MSRSELIRCDGDHCGMVEQLPQQLDIERGLPAKNIHLYEVRLGDRFATFDLCKGCATRLSERINAAFPTPKPALISFQAPDRGPDGQEKS